MDAPDAPGVALEPVEGRREMRSDSIQAGEYAAVPATVAGTDAAKARLVLAHHPQSLFNLRNGSWMRPSVPPGVQIRL